MTAMSGAARAIGAGGLSLVSLLLFIAGGSPAIESYRAQRPTPNGCTADLASLPRGTWVSLEDCAVDKFRSSSFRDDKQSMPFTLAPLRGQEHDLGEPSKIALAFTDSGAVSFVAHKDAQLYSLRDQIGVVLGSMDGLAGAHLEVADIESGVAPGAVLIAARAPPPTQTPLTLLAGGGVFLVLAAWVAMRGRNEEVPVQGVRWGLVAVLLIVSLAASIRTLQWFFDPMRQTDEAAARDARRPPAVPSSAVPSGAVTSSQSDPTADELKRLEAVDGLERLRAADALMTKAVTPELIVAVDRAFDREGAADFKARLVCLKARFPGPESLEFLLRRFPSDRRSLIWNLSPDLKCTFEALVARIGEEPLRIRDALVPGAFSDNATVRYSVLAAFRTVDFAIPPLEILKALNSDNSFEYRQGLQAALALGAVRHNRAAVERAAFDFEPAVRGLVRHELITNPHPNAARIVAKGWILRASGTSHERLAFERERAQHDVSAALLEFVKNVQEPDARRAEAVRLMVNLDEIGVLPELEALRPDLGPGPMLDAVNAAIAGFDAKRGRPSRMRPLSP